MKTRPLNIKKYPWMAHGPRPTCINHGCNNPVCHQGTRWRSVCYKCHEASYGEREYEPGVTPYRTGECSNQDGHLGFPCPMDYEAAPWAIGLTEVEHMDENYFNNVLENVEELCPVCHKQKGKLSGVYKTGKKYAKAA